MQIELQREKRLSFVWRSLFIGFTLIRKFIPKSFLLTFFLNANWVTNRLAYDQFYYKFRSLDLLRPNNHEDFLNEIESDQIVCDFGAGSGELTRKISPICSQVMYLDSDPKALALARSNLSDLNNVRFSQSIEDITEKQIKFDLIILSHVIEHIEQRRDFLESLQILTRKICLEVPDLDSSALNYARIIMETPIWTDEDHVVEMNTTSLENLLYESGWKPMKVKKRGGTIFMVATCEK